MLRWVLLMVLLSGSARADVGVRIAPRGGVALDDDVDPYVGAELRLSFPRSPLTIQTTFDDVLDENVTTYQLSFNALYYLPVPTLRLDPYVGIGANATTFSYTKSIPGVDDNGYRLGMNLIAGACFDLPVASPFVQVTQEIGEFDLLTIGGGIVIALDRDDTWTACGRRAR